MKKLFYVCLLFLTFGLYAKMDISKILKLLTIAVLLFATSCGTTKKYEQTKATNSINAYENYLAKYPKSKYANLAKQDLVKLYEVRDWENTKYANTISKYKEFISKYNNSKFILQANKRISELEVQHAWAKAKNNNSIYDYESFLAIFPNSKYAIIAKNKIEQLKEERAWNQAERWGTLNAYENFLTNFPYGDYSLKAAKKIKELEIILPEWEKATKKNSVGAYRLFLGKFPYASFATKAKDKLKVLEHKKWTTAKQKNTITLYKNYLSDFPHGAFSEEAEKRIIDLEVDAIFKGNHGKLPPMSQSSSNFNNHYAESEVEVFNNTEYSLTLRYSGPKSKKVIFKPKEKKTFNLHKGTYRVAASVNVSGVRNYAGTEKIIGGMIYESQYYIKSERSWR